MDITEATVWKLTLDNAPSSWSCPEYFPNQNNKNVHSDRIAPDRQKAAPDVLSPTTDGFPYAYDLMFHIINSFLAVVRKAMYL